MAKPVKTPVIGPPRQPQKQSQIVREEAKFRFVAKSET